MRVHRGVSAYVMPDDVRAQGDDTRGGNEGCDLSEPRDADAVVVDGRCKVEGRDQRLVYQPRDSRRLSRVPRDEFIGFIIKRGSRNTPTRVTRPGNLYTYLALALYDEIWKYTRARPCFVTSFIVSPFL